MRVDSFADTLGISLRYRASFNFPQMQPDGLAVQGQALQDKTRQDKRPIAVEGNPKTPFFLGFYSNSRHLPWLTVGVGATPNPLHAQLVPSNTGTHFTHHEWMENWVNFGTHELGFEPGTLECSPRAIPITLRALPKIIHVYKSPLWYK